MNPLVIDPVALPNVQNVQPPISVTRTLRRELTQSTAQVFALRTQPTAICIG